MVPYVIHCNPPGTQLGAWVCHRRARSSHFSVSSFLRGSSIRIRLHNSASFEISGRREVLQMGHVGFTFVNLSARKIQSKTSQDDDLSSIRSHAMRSVRRHRKRTTPVSRFQHTQSTARKARDELFNLQQFQGTRLDRQVMKSFLAISFASADTPSDAGTHLDYFLFGFTTSTFPTRRIRHDCDMIRIVATTGDQALLRALCAISALHRAQVTQTFTPGQWSSLLDSAHTRSTDCLKHKLNAIRLLRSRFSRPDTAHLVASVATVALLLLIEVMGGDHSTISIHRRGLSDLMMQSGWQDCRFDLLTSDVLMVDIKSTALTRLPPLTGVPKSWQARFDLLKTLHCIADGSEHKDMCSGFFSSDMQHNLGAPFVLTLSAMRNMIILIDMDVFLDGPTSVIDGRHFLALEYELLLGLRANAAGFPNDRRLLECCRLAALLYCNVCVWTWPKGTTLVECLLSQLRRAILDWSMDPACSRNQTLLLWLYFMGAAVDSDTEDGQFYKWGVRVVAQSLDLRTAEDLRAVLKHFFFVSRLMDKQLGLVFGEVLEAAV